MLINILLIILGMVMLIKGGDWLVDGASSLARRYKISELAIGLTIVAFGTSAPELVVSFIASLNNHPEIALGNVIGSNNFNLFLILGVTGLVAPLAVEKNTVRIEVPFSLFSAIVLFLLGNYSFITASGNLLNRIDGLVLLLFFALFIFYVFKNMKTMGTNESAASDTIFSLGKSLLFIILGLILLVAGGRIVVDAAVELALALHISEKIIALTIVAAGTSLPELVTSITAIVKRNTGIAIGNIIGSNIFNIFLILGVSATARPMEFSPVFNRDIYFLISGTLFFLAVMFIGQKRILNRWKSAIFVIAYVGYVVYLIMEKDL